MSKTEQIENIKSTILTYIRFGVSALKAGNVELAKCYLRNAKNAREELRFYELKSWEFIRPLGADDDATEIIEVA